MLCSCLTTKYIPSLPPVLPFLSSFLANGNTEVTLACHRLTHEKIVVCSPLPDMVPLGLAQCSSRS